MKLTALDWTRNRRPGGWNVPWRDCCPWWVRWDIEAIYDDDADRPVEMRRILRRTLER